MVGPKGHFCDLENAEVTNGVEHDDWTVKGEWRAVLLALRPRCDGAGPLGAGPLGAWPLGRGRWGRGRWGGATGAWPPSYYRVVGTGSLGSPSPHPPEARWRSAL